jgi:hypothetical protein
MRWFLIDKVIQREGFYAYNIHNIIDKHISACTGAGRQLQF